MKIKMRIEAKIYTTMNKIHTKMKSNKMKKWMHKNIINEAEEYAVIHKISTRMN